MIKLFFTSVFFILCFMAEAQVVATKSKMYFWGESGHHFQKQMTATGRRLFDSLFQIADIDTVTSYRLTKKDFLDNIPANALAKRLIQSVTLSCDEGYVSVVNNKYPERDIINRPKSILLRYIRDQNNSIDRIVANIYD